MSNGLVKIGRSKSKKRHKQIQSCNAETIVEHRYFSVEDMSKSEIEAHLKFKDKRVIGEYFTEDYEVVCKFLESISK